MASVVRNTKSGWLADLAVYVVGTVLVQVDSGEPLCNHKVADGIQAWESLPVVFCGPDVLSALGFAPGRVDVPVTTSVTLAAAANTTYRVKLQAGGTATLPTAVGNTSTYQFKNEDSADHNVATTSSQTIEGVASPYVFPPGAALTIYSDNVNWRTI